MGRRKKCKTNWSCCFSSLEKN